MYKAIKDGCVAEGAEISPLSLDNSTLFSKCKDPGDGGGVTRVPEDLPCYKNKQKDHARTTQSCALDIYDISGYDPPSQQLAKRVNGTLGQQH